MTMESEAKFLNAAKRALDEAEKNLDPGTVARLRAARREALEQGQRRASRARPAWLLPLGGFATAAIVLSVAALLWFAPANQPANMQANVADIDLLTAHESPEFFADLDFLDWLDHDDNGTTG
ncbi:MAG: DUF3619 family protein [Gammaproteobacteria bacterium]|nr:DUF3619 family protein [Gammaproteobacteria bacterium]